MDEDKCVELLEKHGVKSTANRIMIVKALAESQIGEGTRRQTCAYWQIQHLSCAHHIQETSPRTYYWGRKRRHTLRIVYEPQQCGRRWRACAFLLWKMRQDFLFEFHTCAGGAVARRLCSSQFKFPRQRFVSRMCRETRHPKSVKNTFRVRFFEGWNLLFFSPFPVIFYCACACRKKHKAYREKYKALILK